MQKPEVENILSAAGLRSTPVRTLVLRTLSDARHPLSSLDLERELETVDRSSITRTMVLFVENGLVHSVDDGSGAVKYELCHHHHEDGESHSDLHPHFHCTRCGTTYCFEDQHIPEIALPEGFIAREVNYVVKGLCPKCKDKL